MKENEKDGTCELVIYCHQCTNHYQLNPEMIALSLLTKASVWDVYEYILTKKCSQCKESHTPNEKKDRLQVTFRPDATSKLIDFEINIKYIDRLIQMLNEGKQMVIRDRDQK